MARRRAVLALADGQVFEGDALGAEAEVVGEVVFNTSHTGYQEIFTDPSYAGQIVCLTQPEIGNYGVNRGDAESHRPWTAGVVVREVAQEPSNWRAEQDLDGWLRAAGVPGISGIDTRMLVRRLRDGGAQMAVLSTRADTDPARLVQRAREAPGLEGRDLATGVSTEAPYDWDEGAVHLEAGPAAPTPSRRVVVIDYGVKRETLRLLREAGCAVRVMPASASAEAILAEAPDGVLVSNGPGDPAAIAGAADQVAGLLGKVPVFGICLGCQVLGLALGGRTYKLKFGHHGGNHPVKDLATGRVVVTSENHGFALDPESLPQGVEVTHRNLNDGTVEGIAAAGQDAFAVQFHPEAAPGPHDSRGMFERFLGVLDQRRAGSPAR